MKGFNLEKFIIDLSDTSADFITDNIKRALNNQNLEINGDRIVGKESPLNPFKVEDWIVKKNGEFFSNGDSSAKIVRIDGEHYWLSIGICLSRYNLEKHYKKWTIKDAEPGDILACDYSSPYSVPFIAIFKEYIGDNAFGSYCFQNFEGKLYIGTIHNTAGVHPATLKETMQLFSLIVKEEFLWDSKKLKLYREVKV